MQLKKPGLLNGEQSDRQKGTYAKRDSAVLSLFEYSTFEFKSV